MNLTHDTFVSLYDQYNKALFGGGLPNLRIEQQEGLPKPARTAADGSVLLYHPTLLLNRNAAHMILLHEMCHVKHVVLFEQGRASDPRLNMHGREFKALVKSVQGRLPIKIPVHLSDTVRFPKVYVCVLHRTLQGRKDSYLMFVNNSDFKNSIDDIVHKHKASSRTSISSILYGKTTDNLAFLMGNIFNAQTSGDVRHTQEVVELPDSAHADQDIASVNDAFERLLANLDSVW